MTNRWQGQRVLIIGAARQGQALARYLSTHGAQVTLNDQSPIEDLQAARQALAGLPITWICGGHPLELLENTDRVCVSGGVPLTLPLVQEALKRGLPLTNDTQIFIEACPCPVIGITASAGKTTTTTLVGRIAQAGFAGLRRIWVGGNIGSPLIAQLDQMQAKDMAIMEVSSFQLEQMTISPWIAAILNITPNHLDRHGTMEAYTAAKARILTYQGSQDAAVLGRDDPGAWNLAGQVRGQLVSFGLTQPPASQTGIYVKDGMLYLQESQRVTALLPCETIRLRGEHNLLNVLAACAIASIAGLSAQAMQMGISGFEGVPHRLQWVRSWRGAEWYNDSIATAPERSMAAIRSFSEPLVLVAGGRDKKLPWDDLAALIHQRVDHLIVFGEARDLILEAVGSQQAGQRPYSISVCQTLQKAVQAAADIVQPGDVVLLSPGGTSFDQFRDFEERGECFEKWVKELP
jgi:UDP-N-acetylmuramoylalanine--D-glutamate ligase